VKHPEDFDKVRQVCERRLGRLPAIYAVADVCRPDLLVEIEGVAFSSIRQPKSSDLMTCYENHPTPVGTDGQRTVG
jgi:hypothetical protein